MKNAFTYMYAAIPAFIYAGVAFAEEDYSDINHGHAPGVESEYIDHHTAGVHHVDAAHGAAEHASTGGLPQFDPTWFASQIFWMLIVFAALYLFLGRKVLPLMSDTLDNRRARVENDLDSARKMKDEAERVHQEYEAILTKARAKAAETFASIEEDMKAKTAGHLDEINARAVRETKEMEDSLQKLKANAMKDMDKVAAEIASLAAEKIIGVKTDLKQAQSVVETINKEAA